MRTITSTVYLFDELSESAKGNARKWWRNLGDTFGWHDEYMDSLKAIENTFGFDVRRYDVERVDYDVTLENHHFRGLKLKDFPRDMMPTGFCGDCGFFETFHDVWERTGDPKHAADMALYAFFREWREDYESSFEDEQVDDAIRINGGEFYESGDPA